MKFRPSNGTEGGMFMERWCFRCAKDNPDNDIYCPIITDSMLYEVDDSRYPVEWQCEDMLDPRTWICTSFEEEL